MSSGFGNNGMQGRCYSLWQDFSQVRLPHPLHQRAAPRPSLGLGWGFRCRATGGLTAGTQQLMHVICD